MVLQARLDEMNKLATAGLVSVVHLWFNRRWRTGYPLHQSLYQTELAGAGSPLKRPDGAGLGDCHTATRQEPAIYPLKEAPARVGEWLESGWSGCSAKLIARSLSQLWRAP